MKQFRRFLRSLAIAVLFFCVAASSALAALPSATRELSATAAQPGSVVRVRISVVFPESAHSGLPTAWILQEDWPAEFRLIKATWNGLPYEPAKRADGFNWLFGYPDGEWPVEEGTLTYLLQLPEETNAVEPTQSASAVVFGRTYTCDEEGAVLGTDTLAVSTDAPVAVFPHFELALQPGWNLVSIPYALTSESRELLREIGNIYRCSDVDIKEGALAFTQAGSEIPEHPGEPFWIHEAASEPRSIPLTASNLDVDEIIPSNGGWHSGWNLIGVVGGDGIPMKSEKELWNWEAGSYKPAPDGMLLPGKGTWIYRK